MFDNFEAELFAFYALPLMEIQMSSIIALNYELLSHWSEPAELNLLLPVFEGNLCGLRMQIATRKFHDAVSQQRELDMRIMIQLHEHLKSISYDNRILLRSFQLWKSCKISNERLLNDFLMQIIRLASAQEIEEIQGLIKMEMYGNDQMRVKLMCKCEMSSSNCWRCIRCKKGDNVECDMNWAEKLIVKW